MAPPQRYVRYPWGTRPPPRPRFERNLGRFVTPTSLGISVRTSVAVKNLILFLTHAAMHRYVISFVVLYVSLMDPFPASLLSHPTLLVVVGTVLSSPSDTLLVVGIAFSLFLHGGAPLSLFESGWQERSSFCC
jgi:hypothetical protein